MLQTLNDMMLLLMDVILGWMLLLPMGVALLIVAVGTAAILTFVRPFTTNQDLLQRCKRDKKKLGKFIRQAKRERDKDALARFRATVAQIAMKTLRAEGKPLLLSIIPVAFLAVWCFGRLGFIAPQPDEPITVRAYFPASAIGKIALIVPAEGVTAEDGWIQHIIEDPNKGAGGKVNGWATWKLSAHGREEPYTLEIRYKGKTCSKAMLVDGQRYSTTLELYPETAIQAVQLDLTPYKPFGIVPGFPKLFLDPWLVGYLLITIPVVFLLRWAFNIC